LASKYANNRIVLSVSHLIKRKGINVNLGAIAELKRKYPDLKYLVIGDGPERTFLARLAHDLEIEPQVEFLGQMPHGKAMEYMAISEVFSLPSWDEAFGVVYLEAAMHGKPVIACKGEGIADVIENNVTGLLVKPKDVASLAKAIDSLLENPQRAHQMGERARALVLGSYTWVMNAKRYMEIYRELVSRDG
jgi:glycosyltransferase involved in cell wall biosynthesis